MANIAAVFKQALSFHQGGDFHQAETLYLEILRTNPNHAESLHLLGFLRHQTGNSEAGVTLIRQAISIIPSGAIFHSNLGIVLMDLGRLEEAVQSYQEAVRINPRFADAYANMALALKELGRFEEAAAACRQALTIDPNHANAFNIHGNVLLDLKKPVEAIRCYREALRVNPQFVDALSNLALALNGQGQSAEAQACCLEALRINPRHAVTHNTLALSYLREGRLEQATESFTQALQLKPGYPSPRWNWSLLKLLQGEYADAWAGFELRWRLSGFYRSQAEQPLWDGSPLDGKTILLYAEQGLGDTIQFVRYARLVKERGGRVLVECQPALLRVLDGVQGIDQLYPKGQPMPGFDVHAALMSLAGIFGTTLATIPAVVPYLHPEPDLVERWRNELDSMSGFKVGIVWQGSPTQEDDCHRSVPLAQFAPLAKIPGVRLLSLQVGAGREQLADVDFPITDLGCRMNPNSLCDLAAILVNVDLVITVCTAVAHLTGALGAPGWVALRAYPHWVWLLDREVTPWYPTLRLFRQKNEGDWNSVFAHMSSVLSERLAGALQRRPLLVEISAGELIDKITILEIKNERILVEDKLRNIQRELETLRQACTFPVSEELAQLTVELKKVNEALWDIEDHIRDHERNRDFGPSFVELARSVYLTNDRRSALKRQINDLLGSRLVEEKSYSKYCS